MSGTSLRPQLIIRLQQKPKRKYFHHQTNRTEIVDTENYFKVNTDVCGTTYSVLKECEMCRNVSDAMY